MTVSGAPLASAGVASRFARMTTSLEDRIPIVALARRRLSPVSALSVVVPVLFVILSGWSRRWVGDDAFINFRVIDQIFAGNGPVFNAGERVEIATSPLWLGILALARGAFFWAPLEWVAVVLGVLVSAFGVYAAQRGALLLDGHRRGGELALPLGVIVPLALPPFWDFASSGLESGLVFGWLGGCWWLLVAHLAAPHRTTRGWSSAAACGLGPLIRPDLALFSAAFVGLLVIWPARRSLASRLALVGAAAALPTLWQLFRMGYYGALVPNTAFAKEASLAHWEQGWHYFLDTLGTYAVIVPVLAIGALAMGPRVAAALRAADRARLALLVVPVVAGGLHWLWVLRVGGDFMHGRFLLPGLFTIVLPVAAVRLARPALGALAVVGLWALVVMAAVRVDYGPGVGPHGIADERAAYVGFAGRANPVTIADYRDFKWVRYAEEVRRLAEQRRSVLILGEYAFRGDKQPRMPLADARGQPVVAFTSVGMLSYHVGPRVHVVDELALGDVIAAHQRLTGRGRPGHEKRLHHAWIVARFGDPSVPLPPGGPSQEETSAARRALRCGAVADLLSAARAPMSFGRFFENMGVAVRTHGVRFPSSPVAAAEELCGKSR